jgi:hypothetical protein
MVLLEAEDGFGKPDGPAGATTSLNEFEAENCTSEACNDKDQVDEIHVNAMDWIPCGIDAWATSCTLPPHAHFFPYKIAQNRKI